MGRNKQVTCDVCFKTMRSDTLKRHMKWHENKPQLIDEGETVTQTHRSGTSSAKFTSLNLEELKKNVVSQMNEFVRKN